MGDESIDEGIGSNMTQTLDSSRPWKKYICVACGLIYDEEKGDPDGGLAAGTRFEDIPDDWQCPDCGVTKQDFKPFVKRDIAVASPAGQGSPLSRAGIIIIGAGMAGWAMVEAVRRRDATAPITLVSSCEGHRYNKPDLSVAFSRGPAGAEQLIQELASSASQRLQVSLLANTFVVSVSTRNKQVRTTRGTFTYTKLIIAQGSQTVLPSELPGELCWRVNQLSDWDALSRKLSVRPQRVAIVGAGMIGCEVAESLQDSGHTVHLLSRRSGPLSPTLPAPASTRLLHSLQANGVIFHGNVSIDRVAALPGGSREIRWNGCEQLQVDEVIAATGVATANRIATRAKLDFDNGIAVDQKTLSTSADDVYALGDCISINGLTDRYISPIEQQAEVIADSVSKVPSGLTYQSTRAPVALKTRWLPIVLRGRPDNSTPWHEIRNDDHLLLMEQHKRGEVFATLRVGSEH